MAELSAEIITILAASANAAYWKLDEASGNFADSSGNGFTLTATGLEAGDYRGDGANGFALGNPDLATGEGATANVAPLGATIPAAFTIWFLARKASPSASRVCVELDSTTDADTSLKVQTFTTPARALFRVVADDATVNHSQSTLSTAFEATWHSVCVVRRAGVFTQYVDGVQSGTETTGALGTLTCDRVSIAFDGAATNPFSGAMQHVFLLNRAITTTELATLQAAVRYITVKPGGGGDFTTLAAAHAAINTSDPLAAAVASTIECFAGDAGALTTTTADTIAATIQSAPSARHTGIDAGTSGIAHIAGTLNIAPPAGKAWIVRGMQISQQLLANWTSTAGHNATVTFEKNLMIVTSGTLGAIIDATVTNAGGAADTITGTVTVRNNIVLVKGTASITAGICGNSNAVGGLSAVITLNFNVFGNSISRTAGTLANGVLLSSTDTLLAAGNVVAVVNDNASGGTATAHFLASDTGTGVGTIVTTGSSHNASTDATGDDFGATGAIINGTATDWWTDPATDLTLKAGSGLIDTGVTIGSFSDDIIGTGRPQNGTWDIGAFEKVPVAGSARNSSLMLMGVGT